jgi:hypothetical protein
VRFGAVNVTVAIFVALLVFLARNAPAQDAGYRPDLDLTRYELLAAESASFRITYDTVATEPGAKRYFNTLRAGSECSDVAVTSLATGKALSFAIVGAEQARELGHSRAQEGGSYLAIDLTAPVPERGGTRLRIEKTYRDAKTYRAGDVAGTLVFERSLSIARNVIVLPAGYELIAANVACQIAREVSLSGSDGRIALAFHRDWPGAADLRIEARKLSEPAATALAAASGVIAARSPTPASRAARASLEFPRRAEADRTILYSLLDPDSHSFRLWHDFTETRPGVARYENVVRKGSTASDPAAIDLDTGAALEVAHLRGEAIRERLPDYADEVAAESEVVVAFFDPVPAGGSKRIRILETYTDAARYFRDDATGELVWHRSFGRTMNSVLLPAGWFVCECSIPARIEENDGRIRLDFVNDRPDEIEVIVRARRR